jgi:hypothetical protein
MKGDVSVFPRCEIAKMVCDPHGPFNPVPAGDTLFLLAARDLDQRDGEEAANGPTWPYGAEKGAFDCVIPAVYVPL